MIITMRISSCTRWHVSAKQRMTVLPPSRALRGAVLCVGGLQVLPDLQCIPLASAVL